MPKVSELIGAQLDYWVARAEGVPAIDLYIREIQRSSPPAFHCVRSMQSGLLQMLDYSTNWAAAGPIIEREMICLDAGDGMFGKPKTWAAWLSADAPVRAVDEITGPTPLIAAMRCYVASKFGPLVEEVPPCGS